MSKEEISRKRRIRGGHRTSVKRLINGIDEYPRTIESVPKFQVTITSLNEKQEILKSLNDELLNIVEEGEIDEEIERADEFALFIRTAIADLETIISKIELSPPTQPYDHTDPTLNPQDNTQNTSQVHTTNDNQSTADSENESTGTQDSHGNIQENRSTSHLKLPKLTMKEYDGKLEQWTPFWDSFEATIHNHPLLPDIDKFNYLRGLVKAEAAQAIEGLALTSANYLEAIDILKRRFGNKQAIINQHMKILMDVEINGSGRNIRRLYDSVESHVRALKSIGVPSSSFGCMLTSVIINKLPNDIRLTLSRDLKGEDWEFDKLMEMLRQEIEARERAFTDQRSYVSSHSNPTKPQQPYNRHQKTGTATALLTSNDPAHTKPTCTYCQRPHSSNSCRTVTNVEARKEILRRTKRCFVCLRKDHFGRNCDAKNCQRCDSRHHISLCPLIHSTSYSPASYTSYSQNHSSQTQDSRNASYQNYNHQGNGNQSSYGANHRNPNSNQGNHPGNPNNEKVSNGQHNNNHSRGDNPNYHSTTQSTSNSSQDARLRSDTVLYVESTTPVLLQTAQCIAFSPFRYYTKVKIRLILDCGSQRTYITDRIREYLHLPAVDEKDIIIKTFGSTEGASTTVDIVHVNLNTNHGDISLNAFTVPYICDPLTCQPLQQARRYFPQIPESQFADTPSNDDIEVDMLVGSDQYWNLVTGGLIRGENGPSAIFTKLGWVLSGPIHTSDADQCQNTNLITTHVLRCDAVLNEASDSLIQKSELDDCLRKFWDLESLGITPRSVYEDLSDSICFKEGRYEVRLPWKNPHPLLTDNFVSSLNRFRNLMRRLRREPHVLKQYDQVIQEQQRNGILELVDENDTGEVGKTHYLPHHAVVRTDKETTKLRIVYDASDHTQGPSLNDCLLIGPPLTHNILDILLRFRVNKIGLAGDIEKAFLMISVVEDDRDVLRFLWVKDINDEHSPLITLRFARVAFGVSSSPFLLNATIKYHMEQYLEEEPDFVQKFLSSIYVDDLSSGADTVDEAFEFYAKSKNILAKAGFNLRKFVTNSEVLSERIKQNESIIDQSTVHSGGTEFQSVFSDEETYAKLSLGVQDSAKEEQKILGVRWDFHSDLFVFDLQEIADLAKKCVPTKRNIVSLASKIFDPFGYLSPVTIQLKMLFQELCKSNYDWDTELRGDNLDKWYNLVESLQAKTSYYLPRCLYSGISETVLDCSLHGFCDASMKAYGAVVYLRLKTSNNIHVRFLVAKTRVSPITTHTIPRLELLSGLVLARLISSVKGALEGRVDIHGVHCWTDSKVSLFWIKGEHREYKQFVQNRISEIRNLTPIEWWSHCSGKSNPADILSRGVSPYDLSTNTLWQTGPIWLNDFLVASEGEIDPEIMPDECLGEMRIKDRERLLLECTSLLATDKIIEPLVGQVINCKDFSDYHRLIRVTAYVLKFIEIVKDKFRDRNKPNTSLKPKNIDKAELLWLKDVQSGLSDSSKFNQWKREFGLVTDENGLIKCQGRLINADIPVSTQNPILLDSHHYVTSLIVKDCHLRVKHCGVKSTLTELRSRFWIIRGRQFIRKLLHQCVICRRYEGKPYQVLAPPPLPSFRVNESPPFSYTGIDFAGPLFVKPVHGNEETQKVWISLFTCCSTRAVHLDLMPDLTTDTFLRCFKRFAARFGTPVEVLSDNAKTFGSAAEHLKLLSDNSPVKDYFAKERINWSFNLEKAPWWGGIFERLIKSTKRCVKKTIGNAKLSYDELLTVVVEIETILNCRPLSYISSEDCDEPLTPSHLLYGRRLLGLPSYSETLPTDYNPVQPTHLQKRHFHMNMVLSHFWSRWKAEYLLELRNTHRSGSSHASNDVLVGDMVIVNEENQPRTLWKLGKVEELVTGKDGLSRGAIVRVSSKGKSFTLRRPIQLLYPLEVTHQPIPKNVDPVMDNKDPVANPIEPESSKRPRRAAAIKSDTKRSEWISQLTSDTGQF